MERYEYIIHITIYNTECIYFNSCITLQAADEVSRSDREGKERGKEKRGRRKESGRNPFSN